MTQTLTDTLQRFKEHCLTCPQCRGAVMDYNKSTTELPLCPDGRAILMALLDVVFGD